MRVTGWLPRRRVFRMRFRRDSYNDHVNLNILNALNVLNSLNVMNAL